MTSRRYFVVRDPVHGDIHLSRAEGRIIDTPQMQRLRGIQQLGLTSLVFPGARHSRFEHSIGTLHMAQVLIDAVNRNAAVYVTTCRRISDDEQRIIRAAALVHDVTHIPFGHNIEDQTGILPRHDMPERFLWMLSTQFELGRELSEQGLLEPVLDVLGVGESSLPPFMSQMISDTICADIMDYLRRDAYYTGLNLHYDLRIADYFKVDQTSAELYVDCEKEGLVREDIVSEILRMLQARYYFSERVYYHHAKIAAGAMVARIVEIALHGGWLDKEELYLASDESLLFHLRQLVRQRLARDPDNKDGRTCLLLLDRLKERRLFKRVSVFPFAANQDIQGELLARFFSPRAMHERRSFENELQTEFRKRFGRDEIVMLYCPNRKMQLKEVDTLVRFPNSVDCMPLSKFRRQLPGIADLEESYTRLWKVYVFTTALDQVERRFLQDRVRAMLPDAKDLYRIN